jgi:hypothetical protein
MDCCQSDQRKHGHDEDKRYSSRGSMGLNRAQIPKAQDGDDRGSPTPKGRSTVHGAYGNDDGAKHAL